MWRIGFFFRRAFGGFVVPISALTPVLLHLARTHLDDPYWMFLGNAKPARYPDLLITQFLRPGRAYTLCATYVKVYGPARSNFHCSLNPFGSRYPPRSLLKKRRGGLHVNLRGAARRCSAPPKWASPRIAAQWLDRSFSDLPNMDTV